MKARKIFMRGRMSGGCVPLRRCWVLVEYWVEYRLAVSLRSTPALTKNFLCFHVSLISLLWYRWFLTQLIPD